jgi:type VI secretion system secreted protein Hcp
MAAVDYFMNIDGIKGESTDSKHKGEIEVESFSWGETNTGSHASGSGGGSGKVQIQDLHFVKKYDKSSPVLALKCAGGDHIKSAVLTCRKAGTEQQEYLVIKMTDLLISSYQVGGSQGGNVVPTDQVSLNFSKIEAEYKPQKADGSLDAGVKFGWDQKLNKKV